MKTILVVLLLISSNAYAANQWVFTGATRAATVFSQFISYPGDDQADVAYYYDLVRRYEDTCRERYDYFRPNANEIKIAYRLSESRAQTPRPGYTEGQVACDVMTVSK